MKNNGIHSHTRGLSAYAILPLAALLWLPATLASAQSNEVSVVQVGQQSMMGEKVAQSGMRERCQAMMDVQRDMRSEMKTNDAELDQLLAAMNKAKGKHKVDAMAAVINKMAEQRNEMQQRMLAMHSRMMQQMMAGPTNGASSLQSCPMMKGKQGMMGGAMMRGGMMGQQNATPKVEPQK